MSIKILSKQDIEQTLSMPEAIHATEQAFLQLANKAVDLPLRVSVDIADANGTGLFMPAVVQNKQGAGVKILSIIPDNPSRGLATINGAILLLDVETGLSKALLEASFLTALRTGAISGLATQYFAKKEAKHLAIIGSGQQAVTQLQAVLAVRNIEQISVWSRDVEQAKKFVEVMQTEIKIPVKVYADIQSTVKHADVICCATAATEALIHLQDIQQDCHINAIGSHTPSMKEIGNDVLAQAKVIVDQTSAVLAEAGEIISAVQTNMLHAEDMMELADIVATQQVCYQNDLTVFKSVGLAIQDIACAELAYQNAVKADIGIDVPF